MVGRKVKSKLFEPATARVFDVMMSLRPMTWKVMLESSSVAITLTETSLPSFGLKCKFF